MADHHGPEAEPARDDALADLGRKIDTVAGALAAIAGSHTDLLGHVAEAEARRHHDAREVTQRLGALERQILALGTAPPSLPADPPDPLPAASLAEDVERLRTDLALGLDVLANVAAAVERLDLRAERQDVPNAEVSTEVTAELASLRDRVERIDVAGPVADAAAELRGRLTLHTDTALAGALRVIDDRLAALRTALTDAHLAQANVGGFEAGAVMGATQAAWNRLEQRLDAEFDDLGRQLQAMAAVVEQTAATAEAVANRPVVTTEQLRKAASAVKDSVTSAGRTRRGRRGGPRGLGSGDP